VISANEFLTRVNLMGGDRFPDIDTPVGIGRDVVVIGAGNTAMDCMRVARRLRAEVRCVYRRSRAEAPARAEELRHAEEEGVQFLFLHNPVEVLTDDAGVVRGLRIERMELGEPDEYGRRRPLPTGEISDIECDTVVVALGTNPNPIVTRNTAGLDLDDRGYVAADPVTQATNLPGVFAGGDIVTGGATVILAMGAGRRAAAAMLEFLDGRITEAPGPVTPGRLCPRCHRPTEDDANDGGGVCCAGSILAWRCTGCAKRSEGFAFPYGRCPACGGVLEVIDDHPAIGGNPATGGNAMGVAALEAVRHAFEIELGGRDFYVAAAGFTGDPELHDMFERLAKMEREHIDTLVRRYHIPPPADAPGDLHPGVLQAGGSDTAADPMELLEMAITLERRAEQFFRERLHEAAPAARELYRELAAEEAEHVDLLVTELAALRVNRRGIL
jgi:bacterioferritin (cytochrome b1)